MSQTQNSDARRAANVKLIEQLSVERRINAELRQENEILRGRKRAPELDAELRGAWQQLSAAHHTITTMQREITNLNSQVAELRASQKSLSLIQDMLARFQGELDVLVVSRGGSAG